MKNAPNIRKAIMARLEEIGENRLWLANQCDGEPKKAHIYAFLSDTSPGEMRMEYVEKILGILGLDLTAAEKNPPKRRRPAILPPDMPV